MISTQDIAYNYYGQPPYLRASSLSGCSPCHPGSVGAGYPTALPCSNCSAMGEGLYSTEYGTTACLSCGEYSTSKYSTVSGCGCVGGAVLSVTDKRIYKCSACAAGAVLAVANNYGLNATCSMCTVGKVVSPYNDLRSAPCAVGYLRFTNATICEPCIAGSLVMMITTSASDKQQQACVPCPPGTFLLFNKTSCAPCPSKTYAPFGGATACLNCTLIGGSEAVVGATTCVCGIGYYLEPSDGTCRLCTFRCAPGGGVVTPGACTLAGTTNADFSCMCPIGYRGDGFGVPCLRCAVVAECSCPIGSYYWRNNNNNVSGCVQCIRCPPLAATLSPCLLVSGRSNDPTVCVCPALHYYNARLNLCVPCSACAKNATTIAVCLPGAVADVTVCACKIGAFSPDGNNGFVCRA